MMKIRYASGSNNSHTQAARPAASLVTASRRNSAFQVARVICTDERIGRVMSMQYKNQVISLLHGSVNTLNNVAGLKVALDNIGSASARVINTDSHLAKVVRLSFQNEH
jgi:hypothetical protein